MNKNLLLFIVIMVFIIFRFSIQGNDKIANTKINKLLEIANSYTGVSYKAGGTTKNGMDCSGLVNTSFKQVGIQLPRSSKAMSVKGKEIALIDVRVGDLLFLI
ncbi:C40 family peptidase [Tenacibaculum sp. AHE15PA]|nr:MULTISPECIES: NlpC/P60 family protein [unclassified Tenacibaculum]QXP73553.1 C40 family peptidase [Tenacibaculum sp. AHE14PA]QXP75067.1 C40 family peptidase [Tenacibaculum sp. AHE15PA]